MRSRSLLSFVRAVVPGAVTLVGQDWGGILGLSLPVDMPELVARLIVMNTAIPTGEAPPSEGFEAWKAFVAKSPDLAVDRLMKRAAPSLTDAEAAAYQAPFVDSTYLAGVRRFPAIVPISPDMQGADISKKAAKWWATEWSGKTFMAVGAQDPVLGPPVMKMMQALIKGCPDPLLLEDAGHFVQESGDVVAKAALEAFGG